MDPAHRILLSSLTAREIDAILGEARERERLGIQSTSDQLIRTLVAQEARAYRDLQLAMRLGGRDDDADLDTYGVDDEIGIQGQFQRLFAPLPPPIPPNVPRPAYVRPGQSAHRDPQPAPRPIPPLNRSTAGPSRAGGESSSGSVVSTISSIFKSFIWGVSIPLPPVRDGKGKGVDRLTGHECTACLEPIKNIDIQGPCGDYYDLDCILGLFHSSLKDETLFPPRCCRQPIPLTSFRQYLTQDQVQQYEDRSVEVSTKKRVYCFEPTCSKFLGPAFDPTRWFFPPYYNCTRRGCKASTCTTCRLNFQGILHTCAGEPNKGQPEQQVVALGSQQQWATCPGCSMMIELDTGCFHMTCRCKTEFCYRCKKVWKTCPCPQWDENFLIRAAERRVDAVPARRAGVGAGEGMRARAPVVGNAAGAGVARANGTNTNTNPNNNNNNNNRAPVVGNAAGAGAARANGTNTNTNPNNNNTNTNTTANSRSARRDLAAGTEPRNAAQRQPPPRAPVEMWGRPEPEPQAGPRAQALVEQRSQSLYDLMRQQPEQPSPTRKERSSNRRGPPSSTIERNPKQRNEEHPGANEQSRSQKDVEELLQKYRALSAQPPNGKNPASSSSAPKKQAQQPTKASPSTVGPSGSGAGAGPKSGSGSGGAAAAAASTSNTTPPLSRRQQNRKRQAEKQQQSGQTKNNSAALASSSAGASIGAGAGAGTGTGAGAAGSKNTTQPGPSKLTKPTNSDRNKRVQEAMEDLRANAVGCQHPKWKRGPSKTTACESCSRVQNQFIMTCTSCQFKACNPCRKNRL